MSKEMIVFVLGIALLIIPHIGVPENWKLICYTVMGVALTTVGYSLRRAAYLRSIEQGNGERSTDSYVESTRAIDWPDKSAI